MTQTFTLDLQTLLQILARQKQHGLLQTEIPPNKLRALRSHQALQAKLFLENGIVYACMIVQRSGENIFEGQEALQMLFDLGIMKWDWMTNVSQLQTPQQSEARPVEPENISSIVLNYIPRRTSRGENLQQIPREYRKILALVDGQRSVRKLAAILSIQDEEMVKALQILQARGMIV